MDIFPASSSNFVVYDQEIKIGWIPALFEEEGSEDKKTQKPGNL